MQRFTLVTLLIVFALCFASFVQAQEGQADKAEQGQQQHDNQEQQDQQEQQEQREQQKPTEEEEDEAKPAGEDEDEDELLLNPHPEVSVSYLFPDNPDRRFKLGDAASILLGFQNRADQAFNISGIGAHLHNPFDLGYYVQNFTARRISGSPVGTGQFGSVEYQFRPDSTLDPNEYWLTAWVIYNNTADQVFRHFFYNGTVELYDDSGNVTKIFLNFFLGVALVGLLVFILLNVSSIKKTVRKSTSSSIERGTRSTEDIQIYKQATKQRVISRKSNTKKSKKAGDD